MKQSIPETSDDFTPPTGWEAPLWRSLIALAFLLAGYTIDKFNLTASIGDIDIETPGIPGICYFLAAIIAGYGIIRKGINELFNAKRTAQLNLLVAIAVLAAIVAGEYPTAVLIAVIMELGHLIEEKGVRSAGVVIESLAKLTSRRAHLVQDNIESDVSSADLEPGMLVRVYPGEVLPADGQVISGNSAIDPAHLTGESTPENTK